MRKVFLAEATAYDPKENKLVTVRMCSRGQGHIAFSDLPDAEYVPCITAPPQQTVSFNQDGIPGQIQVEYGTLGVSFARDLRNTHWRRFDFDGYPCRLLYGDAGSAYSSYSLIPGSKLGALESEENGGSFAIRGPEIDLTKDILTDSYGGTGGADGREDLKGTLKPFAVGPFENWQPVLIDPVNLIYQFHGYGPAGDVTAVYENALTLGPARLSAQSYDALAALTATQLPPGSWAKAPAVGMFRLGAEAIGKLTFDGVGAIDGGVAHTGVASICAFMLRRFGGVPADKIDMASATRLDRTFPHLWGNCVDAQAKPDETQDNQITYSVGDFVREAMAHVAGYLFATPDGVWHFGRNVSTKPPITLRQSRSARPIVLSVGSPATSTRVQRVRVGGRRCFVTHSDNEISSALKDAIETVANDAVEAGKKADEAKEAVAGVRKQLPDLVGPLLQKPIDDLSALHIEYGASLSKAQFALHNKNLVAIREIGTRVEEDGSKVAEEVLQLTSRLTDAEKAIKGIDVDGPIEAGLAEIRRTIANANYASSEAIDLKIANYGKNVSAWQTEEERVRSEKDSALAEDIETMGVSIRKDVGEDITKLEGSFNDFRKLLVDKDGNITAVRQDELGVKLTETVRDVTTAYEGAIRVVEEARIEDGKATAKSLENLQAAVTVTGPNGQTMTVGSAIQELRQTIANDDGTESQAVINLQSRMDNFEGTSGAKLEQAFRTYANKTDGIGSQYTLKVQTDQNGQRFIAGMGLAIENGVSAFAFSADSFRITTPGQTAKQIFYADANGVFMDDVTVNKFRANSIDNEALKRAAASKTQWQIMPSDVACPRNRPTDVVSLAINKMDNDSILKVTMFSQTFNADDLHFIAEITLDGNVRQTAEVRMAFDNNNSRGQLPITPFAFMEGVPAGQHTVSFRITSQETESPIYVRAGSTLEVTELRRASY